MIFSDYSAVVSGSVISAAPAEFALVQKTDTKIVFSWRKVNDREGYVIYRFLPESGKYKAVKNINDNNTLTYSLRVNAGEKSEYAMRAFRMVDGKKVYSDYTEIISN